MLEIISSRNARFPAALLLLFWSAFTLLAGKNEPPSAAASSGLGRFMDAAGTYVLDGGLIIEVEDFPHGLTGYRIKKIEAPSKNSAPVSLEATQETVRTASGWFLYAESPVHVWVYDGRKFLFLYEVVKNQRGPGAGFQITSSEEAPALAKNAPPAVRERFNAELKKKSAKTK